MKRRGIFELVLSAMMIEAEYLRDPLGVASGMGHKADRKSLSQLSYKAYRALVYEDPDFITFFAQSTPIHEIQELNIGSRPSRRVAGSEKIEDLRAIPWGIQLDTIPLYLARVVRIRERRAAMGGR